jgi:hypothetical protein
MRSDALLMAALESADGDLHGLDTLSAGFAQAGYFRVYGTVPIGTSPRAWYDFADAPFSESQGWDEAPELLWLASHFASTLGDSGQALYRSWAIAQADGTGPGGAATAKALWWYGTADLASALRGLPPDRSFGGRAAAAAFRSSWLDGQGNLDRGALAVYVKGGQNGFTHGHRDVGSFVIAANGYLWAEDPGAESYSAYPSETLRHVRNTTFGHNVLGFADAPIAWSTPPIEQALNTDTAVEVLRDRGTDRSRSFAVLDLAPVYDGPTMRGVATLSDRAGVLIRDELTTSHAMIAWNWYSQARPSRMTSTVTQQWLVLNREDSSGNVVATADLYLDVLDASSHSVPYTTSGDGWELTYDNVTTAELNPTQVQNGRCRAAATCSGGVVTCADEMPTCASGAPSCTLSNQPSCGAGQSPPWCATVGAPNCAELAPPPGFRRIQILIRGAGSYTIVAQFFPRPASSPVPPVAAGAAFKPLAAWATNDQGPGP